jgi:hypothetical protein
VYRDVLARISNRIWPEREYMASGPVSAIRDIELSREDERW